MWDYYKNRDFALGLDSMDGATYCCLHRVAHCAAGAASHLKIGTGGTDSFTEPNEKRGNIICGVFCLFFVFFGKNEFGRFVNYFEVINKPSKPLFHQNQHFL